MSAVVGCDYKHLTGPAGEAFGIYVNCNVELSDFSPIQRWTAADPSKVFQLINHYDSRIMVANLIAGLVAMF